jgi:hypothetical protein
MINVPGGGQMRVFLSAAAARRFIWEIIDFLPRLPDLAAKARFADKVFGNFLKLFSHKRMHPDLIIDSIIDSRLETLRDEAISAMPAAVATPDSAPAQDTRAPGSAVTVGVCLRWLGGGCNASSCDLDHPPNLRGAGGHTSGRKRGRAPNNNHSGQGGGNYSRHNNNNNNRRPNNNNYNNNNNNNNPGRRNNGRNNNNNNNNNNNSNNNNQGQRP